MWLATATKKQRTANIPQTKPSIRGWVGGGGTNNNDNNNNNNNTHNNNNNNKHY